MLWGVDPSTVRHSEQESQRNGTELSSSDSSECPHRAAAHAGSQYDELLAFFENHDLVGRALGWVDVHLLASARSANPPIWTPLE